MMLVIKQATKNEILVNEVTICAKYLGTVSGYLDGKDRDPKSFFNNHSTFNYG